MRVLVIGALQLNNYAHHFADHEHEGRTPTSTPRPAVESVRPFFHVKYTHHICVMFIAMMSAAKGISAHSFDCDTSVDPERRRVLTRRTGGCAAAAYLDDHKRKRDKRARRVRLASMLLPWPSVWTRRPSIHPRSGRGQRDVQAHSEGDMGARGRHTSAASPRRPCCTRWCATTSKRFWPRRGAAVTIARVLTSVVSHSLTLRTFPVKPRALGGARVWRPTLPF